MCWGAQHHASLFALVLAAAGLAATPALAAAAPPAERRLSGLAARSTAADFTATTDTTEATTQTDLFNPSATGAPLGGARPGATTCKGTPIGKTVWYDLAPQADGDVVIRATGFATVVAVYEWSAADSRITRTRRLLGQRGRRRPRASSVQAERRYTIQVGGAGGAGGPLNLKVDYLPDSDGDGRTTRSTSARPSPASTASAAARRSERAPAAASAFANTPTGIRITRLRGRARAEGREGRRPLRRLRLADRPRPAHRHRHALPHASAATARAERTSRLKVTMARTGTRHVSVRGDRASSSPGGCASLASRPRRSVA